MTVMPLLILVLVAVGVFLLFRWQERRYLKDFVNATRRHYPEISAKYAEQFFPKK